MADMDEQEQRYLELRFQRKKEQAARRRAMNGGVTPPLSPAITNRNMAMSPQFGYSASPSPVPPPIGVYGNSAASTPIILSPHGDLALAQTLSEWAEQAVPSHDMSPSTMAAIRESRMVSTADFAARLARGRSPTRHYPHYDHVAHAHHDSDPSAMVASPMISPVVSPTPPVVMPLRAFTNDAPAPVAGVPRRRAPPTEDRAPLSSAAPPPSHDSPSPTASPLFGPLSGPLPPISPSPTSSLAPSPDPSSSIVDPFSPSTVTQNNIWHERQRSEVDLQRRLAVKLNRSTMRLPSRGLNSPEPSLNALTAALAQPLVVSPPRTPENDITTIIAANGLHVDIQHQAINMFRRFHSNIGRNSGDSKDTQQQQSQQQQQQQQPPGGPPLQRNPSLRASGSQINLARNASSGSSRGSGNGAGASRRASNPISNRTSGGRGSGNSNGSGRGSRGSGNGSGRNQNRASWGDTSIADANALLSNPTNTNTNTNNGWINGNGSGRRNSGASTTGPSQNGDVATRGSGTGMIQINGNGSGNHSSTSSNGLSQLRADVRIAQMGIHWLARKKARDRRRRERILASAIAADDSLAQRLANASSRHSHRRASSSSVLSAVSQNSGNGGNGRSSGDRAGRTSGSGVRSSGSSGTLAGATSSSSSQRASGGALAIQQPQPQRTSGSGLPGAPPALIRRTSTN